MPEHLQPDRLPQDMTFRLVIGEQEIDLAAMSYPDIYTTFRAVLGAVRACLRAKAEQDEQDTDDS